MCSDFQGVLNEKSKMQNKYVKEEIRNAFLLVYFAKRNKTKEANKSDYLEWEGKEGKLGLSEYLFV